MDTDDGGWTLVGSTRGSTMNDRASMYYNDLARAYPNNAHGGIWNGLRGLGNSDIRFTCGNGNGNDPDGHIVDLSFYDASWYEVITTGSDRDSCFNTYYREEELPARRNNLNGGFLYAGTQWGSGIFVGEDFCGDTGDFTVDFNNRGMDDNERDGTDWGEDDGGKKCGTLREYSGDDVSNLYWQIWIR
jgi:hypothetical protein